MQFQFQASLFTGIILNCLSLFTITIQLEIYCTVGWDKSFLLRVACLDRLSAPPYNVYEAQQQHRNALSRGVQRVLGPRRRTRTFCRSKINEHNVKLSSYILS